MSKEKKITYLALIILIIASVIYFITSLPKTSKFKMLDRTTEINDAKNKGNRLGGWVRVEGTNIDMPIIITSPGFYMDKNVDGSYGKVYSRPDDETNHPSIVSHNIRNVSRKPIVGDDTMTGFEQLMSFIYLDFIKENQYIAYTDVNGKQSLYRIYAVSLIDDDQKATYKDTYTEQEEDKYIDQAKKESMYDIDVDVDATDKQVSLLTCTRFYGSSTSYSFKVDARELRDGEKQQLAKVKTNKNYEKIEKRMKEGTKNDKA